MLTQKDLDDSLTQLRTDLTEVIKTSIDAVKDTVINNLVSANKELQHHVKKLEERVTELETELHSNLQYNRLNNLIISGIPSSVEHINLEAVSLAIINTCTEVPDITSRDVEGCHRLSKNNMDVIIRLVNRAVVEEVLDNRQRLKNTNKEVIGLPTGTYSLYLNNHLTRQNATLAYYGRKLKKNGHIKNVSTLKGVIKFLMPTDIVDEDNRTYRWQKISNKKDILDLFPNLDTLIL